MTQKHSIYSWIQHFDQPEIETLYQKRIGFLNIFNKEISDKDLCWWCAVEIFPNSVFLEAVTVLVASALIAHTVDAAVLTWHNRDLIGFVNQATLLCWVCSFAIWCFGEVFFEEYEYDMPGDFTFLTKPPSHPLNLRWWASWVLTAGTVFFFGFWTVYACLVSIDVSADEAKEPPSPPVETDPLLRMAPIPEA